jgi:cysteine desulfurase / selenocysteine lyase
MSQTSSVATIDRIVSRDDFPILQETIYGKPLVYLDSGASSQKPRAVIDAMTNYYEHKNANVHRGAYALSEAASNAYESARKTIARFIHARSTKEIIYTRNTTESINLVAQTWGLANIHNGDTILLTEMEHHSNLVPWQILALRTGARLEFVPVTDDGLLDLDTYASLLTKYTPKLVAFSLMSNVMGTIPPAKEMIALAHAAGSTVLCDGAQSVAHQPTDVRSLDCDFLAFSGHKMLGPTGIGILYGKRALLEAMPPFMGGGDMIREVHLQSFTPNDLPWKFEAGTPAIAEAVGLGAAVEYLNKIGMTRVSAHETTLATYAIDSLSTIPGLRIIGPLGGERGAVVSFTLDGIHPHDLATLLDREGIAVRAGHHCAQPLMERFSLPATARATGYVYTTSADIDALTAGVAKAAKLFS